MAQKYTKNDLKLSKYILRKTKNGDKLPYMTIISKETGISVATISRYAKRKDFYSFADMRATFNKDIARPAFNDHGIVDTLISAKSVTIISSNFTSFIGEYLKSRLEYLKIPTKLIGKDDFKEGVKNISRDSLVICISLTGWSMRTERAMKTNPYNKTLFITTIKPKPLHKNVQVISLTEFESGDDDNFEGYNSIRNIYLWIDDCMNILHLKLKY